MTDQEFEQQIEQVLLVESHKEAFFKLCDLYLVVSAQQRKKIRQHYFFERNWEAPQLRMLAAHLPNEPDREARIRASLILLSLAEPDDVRDDLVIIATIWNSLKDASKDADGWLRYFADISSASAASVINNFLARPPEQRELSQWGWEREITEHGIVYKGWEIDEELFKKLGIL